MKKVGIKMGPNKTISIIIPAYNAGLYLGECIQSVCQQSYEKLEIIIVDDGSTDDTLLIAKELQKVDSRINIIKKENGGVSSARNKGIESSTGEYILFLDADDWLEKNCCEILINEAISSKAEIIFFDYYKEFSGTTVKKYAYKKDRLQNLKGQKPEFFIFNMKTVTPWGKLYKRTCLTDELFDEKMSVAEDVDFNFRIYNNITNAVYIHKCLMHYRVLEQSAIHGFDSQIKNKFEYALKKISSSMRKGSLENRKAYYSFAAIAYLVICQNYFCLNDRFTFAEIIKNIKSFNETRWVKDLFNNYQKIMIPISRKLLILFGKYNFNFGIWIIIKIKKVMKR